MAEYIEREKVLELMSNIELDLMRNFDIDGAEVIAQARTHISDIPAADARPERHGKWEKSCDGYSYFCSICKEEPDRSGRLLSDFCPWCGAKMDRIGD